MKIYQLRQCNMTNIFLKNHTQDVVEKLFLNSIPKTQNRANLGISFIKVLYSLFLLYVNLGAIVIY